MQNTKSDFDFQALKRNWPSAVVARARISQFTGGLVSPGTLANEDSRGTGPRGRFVVGRKVAYPVDAIIEWLQARARQRSTQNPSKNRRRENR